MSDLDPEPGPSGSVTHWIGDLKAGEDEAARRLWDRYFAGLVRMARGRLARGQPGVGGEEEDVALSAFKSLCLGAARGKFPRLGDRDDLARLLVVITARKALNLRQRDRRQKRGGGRVRTEVDLAGADDSAEPGGLAEVAGREPSPEFAAAVADECRRLLDGLGDETLRLIALRKMEGDTDEEVAQCLGCTRRTVVRKLDRIRGLWLELGAVDA